jgi:hypothetical protein
MQQRGRPALTLAGGNAERRALSPGSPADDLIDVVGCGCRLQQSNRQLPGKRARAPSKWVQLVGWLGEGEARQRAWE